MGEEATAADIGRIPIANIYYLLSYAWQGRALDGFKSVALDDFAGLLPFFAEVLVQGTDHLLKRGLDRGYLDQTQPLRTLRGKPEWTATLTTGGLQRGIITCTHDEFTADVLHNQILKAVLLRLARLPDPALEVPLRRRLRDAAFRMVGVTPLAAPRSADVARTQLHRNNRVYRFLLEICRLVLAADTLQESPDAERTMRSVVSDNFHNLFEAFVREFYRAHLPQAQVAAPHIRWDLTPLAQSDPGLLPAMKTDISIAFPDRRLIIDTKFYGKGGLNGGSSDARKFHSGHLYQIHAYITQLARTAAPNAPLDQAASGMLLYATVDGEDFHHRYAMPPHEISLATVNLSRPWRAIESQLRSLVPF